MTDGKCHSKIKRRKVRLSQKVITTERKNKQESEEKE